MEKRKIILDSDPGHDDAVAIMLALSNEKLDLLAITVEAGNQTLEKTGRNALNLVEYFNVDIPVALGESHPLHVLKFMVKADLMVLIFRKQKDNLTIFPLWN